MQDLLILRRLGYELIAYLQCGNGQLAKNSARVGPSQDLLMFTAVGTRH